MEFDSAFDLENLPDDVSEDSDEAAPQSCSEERYPCLDDGRKGWGRTSGPQGDDVASEGAFLGCHNSGQSASEAEGAGPGEGKADTPTVTVFGLGNFDWTTLNRGSKPHLPLQQPKSKHEATDAAGAEAVLPAAKDVDPPWLGPRVNFQIREEVLPMNTATEALTVQDFAAIWEAEWDCKFARRLKFESPDPSTKWLARGEIVPGDPAVVRLEGPGAILDSLTVALKRRGRKIPDS